MAEKIRTSRRSGGGFTLVELLVAIAIVALLAGFLLAGISRVVARARTTSAERSVAALVLGINQFKSQFGFLPPLVHDGEALGGNGYLPAAPGTPTPAGEPTWPVVENDEPLRGGSKRLIVWSEGVDRDFFRRREGSGADRVRLPQGGEWDAGSAWDDRRYSKFSLPFYLSGIGDKRLDGVDGPGMARPQSDGYFVGVAYPVGSSRDRYEPVVGGEGESLRLVTGYLEADEYAEHGAPAPGSPRPADTNAAFVDPWGRAIRYYRWEPGRLVGDRLVVQSTLDLNIPPVLIDPAEYVRLENNQATAGEHDLTGGNAELRSARFAVVSAGRDGLFGTETIERIAEGLDSPVPSSTEEIAELRERARTDNIVGLGN